MPISIEAVPGRLTAEAAPVKDGRRHWITVQTKLWPSARRAEAARELGASASGLADLLSGRTPAPPAELAELKASLGTPDCSCGDGGCPEAAALLEEALRRLAADRALVLALFGLPRPALSEAAFAAWREASGAPARGALAAELQRLDRRRPHAAGAGWLADAEDEAELHRPGPGFAGLGPRPLPPRPAPDAAPAALPGGLTGRVPRAAEGLERLVARAAEGAVLRAGSSRLFAPPEKKE